jgi:hypothetical protein
MARGLGVRCKGLGERLRNRNKTFSRSVELKPSVPARGQSAVAAGPRAAVDWGLTAIARGAPTLALSRPWLAVAAFVARLFCAF